MSAVRACVQPFSCIQWMPLHAVRQVIAMGLSYPSLKIFVFVCQTSTLGEPCLVPCSQGLCAICCVFMLLMLPRILAREMLWVAVLQGLSWLAGAQHHAVLNWSRI